jgi:hypothetical protein
MQEGALGAPDRRGTLSTLQGLTYVSGRPVGVTFQVSEVKRRLPPFLGFGVGLAEAQGQVWSAISNFGEVGICQFKMLSSKGIRVFRPPQLSDR